MRGVDELAFPEDIDAWRRWESRQRRLQRAAGHARRGLSALFRRPAATPIADLLLPEDEPDVLVIVDAWSPSCRFAVDDPLRHLDPRRTAVLTADPRAVKAHMPGRHHVAFKGTDRIPSSIREVVTLGAFNDLAGQVEPWARRRNARFVVVQHGLLTPWAPPLSDGAHVLAWSEDDARYWAAGRRAITWQTIGSQLLWTAARKPPAVVVDERPVMLGQLHGTELHAFAKQRLYTRFCLATDAGYRPHPNEVDAMSRLQHRVMAAAGVRIEPSAEPVLDLGRPVVSIFSTGTLEAAQRGIPAFVHHPDPPTWLRAFWARHRLAPFGGPPTDALPQPDLEPAQAVAQAVQS